ncbi:MAG: histone H1 [Bacteroidota bacterium]|nr:histone H1 [Bacteroidota bacterium]
MNRYAELRELLLLLETDFIKFYEKENKAAGTRVRKGMQELKVKAQEIRTEIQKMKNI